MVLTLISDILPTWQIWPQEFLDGLNYFFAHIYLLNIFVPVGTIIAVILFLTSYFTALFGAKMIFKIANYIRGTGDGLDI
jgi:hypothetical protein